MADTSPIIPGRLTLRLLQPHPLGLERLRGIGPKTAARMRERGILDQLHLLLHMPRKYRPTYRFWPGHELVERRASFVEVIGQITHVLPPARHSRAPLEVRLQVDDAEFKLIWFNLAFPGFVKKFQPGDWMRVEGKLDHDRDPAQMVHPTFDILKHHESRPRRTEVVPIYSSMEEVRDSLIHPAIAESFQHLHADLEEGVPLNLLRQHELPTLADALKTIHVLTPYDDLDRFREDLSTARNRLIYQEFFDLQLALTRRYVAQRRAANAPRLTERELGRELLKKIPFDLTGDQKAAIATIADDLATRIPMRRLLQGDVGSGKTVVALLAAAIAIANGHQVALLAPTEILARQHSRNAHALFTSLNIPHALLVGAQSTAERRDTLHQLTNGEVGLIVGTHALVQDDVVFKNLALVIIDEQHKFGVDQRDTLMAKGTDPHLLAMTATPIPRSLAHAVFGDLDLTLIREKPPGRKPVRTELRDRTRAPKIYDYVKKRILETGEQAYFVYPLVEASDAVSNRRSVTEEAERLANGPLKGLRLGVLHGRMDGAAKDAVMQRFANGDIDVLCATTVVEVGVDVPNATIMVIENPEVFGLSQLHQLRGRVGRGSVDSICILITGFTLTEDAELRLQAFTTTDDGFKLAETDLAIRGPGLFLGVKQAGLPEFRFGDVLRDAHWLQTARHDARRILLGDASR
ncbi:ATP-dependent DNA helicase RecG [Lujinxingia vulgaris]|uniref:ATP-dependent DNA helicase RecG n=1 Tax=Lujinxingia vulgaris TaxID=2600176 RepID=A0A5C6WUD9_9DELT|nr:ATP-dependent DNA helicase RecG [Lujinxingia vulgaris]TXD32188.1 ATP-dependent DNA helicase RecG [Lujinxingia vulgaris]